MTVVFLIKLKFYKEPHLLLFYILSFFILVLRTAYFLMCINLAYEYTNKAPAGKKVSFGANSCDILCCFFKIYMCTVQMHRFATAAFELKTDAI
jgi:hypothetical protein